jgi:hypothetical protein
MGLHKLTAGDGYTYLTRQVAAHDTTEKGHTSLGDYYDEQGESPGRWLGSGLRGLNLQATLYTWRSRRTGYGPRAVKVGGCLRFKRSDLDDWIAEHTEAADENVHRVDSNRGKAPHPAAGVALTRRSRNR